MPDDPNQSEDEIDTHGLDDVDCDSDLDDADIDDENYDPEEDEDNFSDVLSSADEAADEAEKPNSNDKEHVPPQKKTKTSRGKTKKKTAAQ